MTRQHQLEAAYPAMWKAIDGAIRDAALCHPDIQIPDKRRSSITKRAVGSILAVTAGAVVAAKNFDGVTHPPLD